MKNRDHKVVQFFKAKIKLTLRIINLRPQIRPGKKNKIRRKPVERDKKNKKDETVALPQLRLIPLRLQKAKRSSDAMVKVLRGISLRSLTITVMRKATTLGIELSQKTSYSLGNLHVGDY